MMRDFDRAASEVEAQIQQAHHDLELATSPDRDAALKQAITDGTATPEDIDRLARILKPYVRSQLLVCGSWRWQYREAGNELPFVPCGPLPVAVEICSLGLDEPVPPELEKELNWNLEYKPDKWAAEQNRARGHLLFQTWVEAVIVVTAGGGTDFHEIRRLLDESSEDDTDLTEAIVGATARAMEFVELIVRFPEHYSLVSMLNHPFL